ncbi:hypothetical protein Cfor_03674, partial [Coptotermes formosanus]
PAGPPFDLQPDAGLSGITSQSQAAYHAYSSEDVQRPKLHRLHTALELPAGQLEGVSAYRADYDEKHAERQARYKYEDHLQLVGEFQGCPHTRENFKPVRGERALVVRHEDHLKLDGEFSGQSHVREEFQVVRGERAEVRRHEDHLRLEGQFQGSPHTREDYKAVKGERAPVVRHEDHLKLEGDFAGRSHLREEFQAVRGERAEIRRHEDHLRLEGEFMGQSHIKEEYKELEGELFAETTSRSEFREFQVLERTEKVRRRSDNLLVGGGEFQGTSHQKENFKAITPEKVIIKRHPDNLQIPQGAFVSSTKNRDDYPERWAVRPEQPRRHRDNLVSIGGDFQGISSSKEAYQAHQNISRAEVKRHVDNLTTEGTMTFESSSKSEFTQKAVRREKPERRRTWTKQDGEMFFETTNTEEYKQPDVREEIQRIIRQDNLRVDEGTFENRITTSHEVYQAFHDEDTQFKEVKGERAEIKKHTDTLNVGSGNMDMNTTSKDTFQQKKRESVPAAGMSTGTFSRKQHMQSQITLGDGSVNMTTTNKTIYNTSNKAAHEDRTHKQSQDTKTSTISTKQTRTMADGTIVTVTKEVTSTLTGRDTEATGTKTLQLHSNEQSASGTSSTRSTSTSIPSEAKKPEMSSKQSDISDSSKSVHLSATKVSEKKSHPKELHTSTDLKSQSTNIQSSTFETKHSKTHATSSEFRQTMSGSSDITLQNTVTDSGNKSGNHHRKSVITSSSADVSNAVLHRKSTTTSTEALHTISSAASAQRKSISNLCDMGQYISNSSQSQDRKSLSALHRQGVSPGEVLYQQRSGHISTTVSPADQQSHQGAVQRSSAWSSSSIQQQQQQHQHQHFTRSERIMRKDNLSVGEGTFHGQSEARAYGNFHTSTGTTERVTQTQRANTSHIMLGDHSSSSQTASSYKKEFIPRVKGPCPATLLESKETPFKHTRDTQKHRFYLPVVSN